MDTHMNICTYVHTYSTTAEEVARMWSSVHEPVYCTNAYISTRMYVRTCTCVPCLYGWCKNEVPSPV